MYADRRLAELADRKLILQARIAVRRMECAVAATNLTPPVDFVDRMWLGWKQLSPIVKMIGVPIGFLTVRRLTGLIRGGVGKGVFATILGALPMILEVVKAFREQSRSRENLPE